MYLIAAFLPFLLATGQIAVVAAANSPVHTKYTTAGYSAYASGSLEPSCSWYGNYFGFNAYATKDKFKQSGQSGYTQTTQFTSLSGYLDTATCTDSTIDFVYGSTYSDSYYGDHINFSIEGKKLTSASLSDLQMPLYTYSCAFECYEVCYAEIFEYGTCPPEEPYLECYTTTCGDIVLVGVVDVDIVWTSDSGNTPPTQSRSTYHYSDRNGNSYTFTTKGNSRETPFTLSALVDGQSILPGAILYPYGELYSSTSTEVTKTKST